MFTDDTFNWLLGAIKPPFLAIFLYGSHARGDAHEESDVDVLQVTPIHSAPYSVGRVNITCYTLEQLLRIACCGGLFARHLVDEAIAVLDPDDMLGTLKAAYVPPLNYDDVKNEVYGCAPLLDVTEPEFNDNAIGLSSLVTYLVRTYLYATAFGQGAQSFAMDHILDLVGEQRANIILSEVRAHRAFPRFLVARTLFEEITGAVCKRIEGSLEAFIVNASAHNELAMILGLRLLARGRPFTYDALRDLEL